MTVPIEGADGHWWTYSPERDLWFSDDDGCLDWEEMLGWNPEVIEKWAARELAAGDAADDPAEPPDPPSGCAPTSEEPTPAARGTQPETEETRDDRRG